MFVLKQDYFNSKVLEFPKFHSSAQICNTQNNIQSANNNDAMDISDFDNNGNLCTHINGIFKK